MLWAIVGVPLFLLSVAWAPLLLGVLAARFRDIPQIVQNVLLVIFFITPVMWRTEQLGSGRRAWIATLNPLAYIIDVFRKPLLGEAPSFAAWMVVLAVAVAGWAIAIFAFSRARSKIPYWL
jgi:ABC-type polysaccharide/polyol phosphate export permease